MEGLPEVKQFAGGASNLTYLLRYPERDLILRRPPAGHKAKSAHDMRREHFIQSKLKPVFDYVPAMVAFCDDESVIGSDFYVMERLEGTILRSRMPEGFASSESGTADLCRAVLDVLAELHSVDPSSAGLDELSCDRLRPSPLRAGLIATARPTWNVPPLVGLWTGSPQST